MLDSFPPSKQLIPSPGELRLRLAVALREVEMLRRLVRLAEFAARCDPSALPENHKQGAANAN
jgi:hypothetical protein